MGQMLLVIDVGNTNMTFGVYRGQELVTTFRLTTKQPRTSDEYGISITELLRMNGVSRRIWRDFDRAFGGILIGRLEVLIR